MVDFGAIVAGGLVILLVLTLIGAAIEALERQPRMRRVSFPRIIAPAHSPSDLPAHLAVVGQRNGHDRLHVISLAAAPTVVEPHEIRIAGTIRAYGSRICCFCFGPLKPSEAVERNGKHYHSDCSEFARDCGGHFA